MADQQPAPIAIVGMSCRLPGDVSTPAEFWRMLCRARSGWSKVPSDRFNAEAYNHPNPDKKGCFNSQGGYFISDDISMFDAGFFDMTKKEAESMDPAQRLLLECTYEALENAGIPKESVSGQKVGVFVGGNYNEHRTSNLRDLDSIPSFDATGNQGAFLAGRLAYYFNLRGPTLTVDTACSSSMHALHLAVQSVRAGESEQAIVAASHLITQPDIWVSMAKLRLFSDAGKTYAFDHRAKSGYARGEGAGCLVIKPLDRALADNDHIRAVITHTGISHNGRTVGIVAPSPDEQEQLLRDVFAQARIDPRDVGFFEAHGTGTKKGDPIEATAIYKAVARSFTPDDPLYVGSAKANVGHLECASGIVSVIKSVLMLYYGFVLPNADFEQANEEIPLSRWNMRVPTLQQPWPSHRRYACVNNFGFSGSNAHCILTAPPAARELELGGLTPYRPLRLFVVTANDEAALRATMTKLGIWLEQHAELYQTTMPRNLAYTFCQRRSHLPWRVALVAGLCSGLAGGLNSPDVTPMRAPSEAPKLAFVYTGQGAQWHAMGRELLHSHPVFAGAIERADAALRAIGADFSITEELLRDQKSSRVGLAHISQPICSAVQLALTDLLASFGIRPSAVTGHSSGEIGAAYAAGALDFDSAMAAAYYRGQVIIELKKAYPDLRGSMMAVGAGADELGPILNAINAEGGAQAVVACENSPSSTTLSGDEAAIDRLAAIFQQQGVFNRKLFVDVAYHSPHMRLVADSYLDKISHIQPPPEMSASAVEFYSSLRGGLVGLAELGPGYWVDNLTQAVRFSTSLQQLCTESSPDILIEVGPHAALKGPIMQTLKKMSTCAAKISYLPTLVRDKDAARTCLDLAGQLFMRGAKLDFYNINHNRSERENPELVPALFSYPWSRQKCWNESRISKQHRLKPFARHDLLGALADWSNDLEPTWRNILRTADLPWLSQYQVQSRSVFPMAGFMSMALEAASQHAALRGVEAERFEIRDMKVTEDMFVDDGGEFEVLLSLRPSTCAAAGADEFRICSYEAGRGWLEHCHGLVRADPAAPARQPGPSTFPLDAKAEAALRMVADATSAGQTDSSSDSFASSNSKAPSSSTSDAGLEADTPATTECAGQAFEKLEPADAQAVAGSGQAIYKYLAALGVSYPPSFQSLVEATANENEVAAHCCAQDTASGMPLAHETAYKMHPAILDAMLQLPLLSLGTKGGPAGRGDAHLPCAVRQLNVSAPWRKRPNESFCAHSTIDPKSGTFMVEAFSSPGSEAASISIAGLQLRPVRREPLKLAQPRELCFQVRWERAKEVELGSATSGDGPKSGHNVVILTESEQPQADALVSSLSEAIEKHSGVAPRVSSLRHLDEWSGFYVVLVEMSRPMLASITESGFERVKKLLTHAQGLLWVTRGATRFCTVPNANLALGLVRAARSETEAVAATLDLDPNTELDVHAQAALIQDAFRRSVLLGDRGNAEMEFAEEAGSLIVPRIVPDEKLNLQVHRELGPSAPYLQEFHQPGRYLQLAIPTQGPLDDLYFEDHVDKPLADDEVEIFVSASAITQDDTSFVKGSLQRPAMRGCSGTVTRVRNSVSRLSVGSRVCALAEGAFGTHARARVTSVAEIPADLSMEHAACIPVSFCPAYYALAEVARVRAGERLLIQLSGPVGLAAAEVGQYLGANVFALVQNDAESAAARKLGIAHQHVLDARSIYLWRHLEEAAGGQGMDVILTTTAIETPEAWGCLADFGRVVEVRAIKSHQSSRPELGSNATFTAVDMASLAAARPKAMERTLGSVMERFASGSLSGPTDVAILPVSRLAKGLQLVQDGTVRPVVVTAGVCEQVKATHSRYTSDFRSDGTHVIIGGTGGLGRSMARWMVEHGARHIVLLSRSGGGKAALEELCDETRVRHPDARVVVQKCDASDEDQVRQMVHDLSKTFPPICGVIHAAMVLRDGLLETMAFEDYEAVLRPKVRGAWNMHNVLADSGVELDYFVALSSAAGILGSRGQAAYAAANTFLDAFMAYRVHSGLPGTALDLTAVTGAGYLAENAGREQEILRNFGNEAVSEAEVLALLSAAVRGVCGSQCLTGMKLHLGSDGQWPYYANDARFTGLKEACLAAAAELGLVPEQTVSAGNAFREAKSDNEAASIACQWILQKLSEVLSVSMQDLDAARNITSYGLDSLTAIELRNWIAKELRANLQILELLSSGTVNDLAALIVQKTRVA